jgi:hypothetical protein
VQALGALGVLRTRSTCGHVAVGDRVGRGGGGRMEGSHPDRSPGRGGGEGHTTPTPTEREGGMVNGGASCCARSLASSSCAHAVMVTPVS